MCLSDINLRGVIHGDFSFLFPFFLSKDLMDVHADTCLASPLSAVSFTKSTYCTSFFYI